MHLELCARYKGVWDPYSAGAQLNLIGFTNSEWDGDSTDRKSTSGFVFMLRSGPICWSRKKQASLALSSAEVEYRGPMNASIQIVWLHGILTEFGIHTSPSIDIYCGN